jgi:hypothetical protein
MTKLTKPITRECPRTTDRGREIILSLLPGDLLTFRPKGRRITFTLSIRAAYDLSAKLYARDVAMEKKAKRTKGRRT